MTYREFNRLARVLWLSRTLSIVQSPTLSHPLSKTNENRKSRPVVGRSRFGLRGGERRDSDRGRHSTMRTGHRGSAALRGVRGGLHGGVSRREVGGRDEDVHTEALRRPHLPPTHRIDLRFVLWNFGTFQVRFGLWRVPTYSSAVTWLSRSLSIVHSSPEHQSQPLSKHTNVELLNRCRVLDAVGPHVGQVHQHPHLSSSSSATCRDSRCDFGNRREEARRCRREGIHREAPAVGA